MRLAFEDVSYSYEGGEAKKRRGRRKKDAARQAAAETGLGKNELYAQAARSGRQGE